MAHVAGLKLERGYGCKAAFLGDAPFLEMKGRVLGGEVAVLKAIANVRHTYIYTPSSSPAMHAHSTHAPWLSGPKQISILVAPVRRPYCSRVICSCLCVCVCFRRAPRRCVRARPWWTTGWSGDTTHWRPSCIPRVRRPTEAHTTLLPVGKYFLLLKPFTRNEVSTLTVACLLTHMCRG